MGLFGAGIPDMDCIKMGGSGEAKPGESRAKTHEACLRQLFGSRIYVDANAITPLGEGPGQETSSRAMVLMPPGA